MPPSTLLAAVATPAFCGLPSPTVPFHFLPDSTVQAVPAAALRYFVKLSVVPDSSERKKTLIFVAGRVVPELSAAIAGSFHMVIWPRKIFAVTSALRTSEETDGRL
jgi:nitrate reductase NapE component